MIQLADLEISDGSICDSEGNSISLSKFSPFGFSIRDGGRLRERIGSDFSEFFGSDLDMREVSWLGSVGSDVFSDWTVRSSRATGWSGTGSGQIMR